LPDAESIGYVCVLIHLERGVRSTHIYNLLYLTEPRALYTSQSS